MDGGLTLGLAIAGAVASAATAITSGVSASNNARRQAAMAEFNAKIQQRNATIAQQQAQAEADRRLSAQERLRGRQRVTIAKSGVQATGSPLDVIEDTELESALDIQNVLYQGALQQQNFNTNADAARMQAAGLRSQGRQTLLNSGLSAAGSLIGGVGSAVSVLGNPTLNAAKTTRTLSSHSFDAPSSPFGGGAFA